MCCLLGGFLLALKGLDPVAELMQAARLVFVSGVWPVIGLCLIRTSRTLVRALIAFVAGAMLSALVATPQLAGLTVPFAPSTEEVGGQQARKLGPNLHPNGQSGTLAVAIAIAFAFLVHGQAPRFAAVAPAVLAVGVTFLAVSPARS